MCLFKSMARPKKQKTKVKGFRNYTQIYRLTENNREILNNHLMSR